MCDCFLSNPIYKAYHAYISVTDGRSCKATTRVKKLGIKAKNAIFRLTAAKYHSTKKIIGTQIFNFAQNIFQIKDFAALDCVLLKKNIIYSNIKKISIC